MTNWIERWNKFLEKEYPQEMWGVLNLIPFEQFISKEIDLAYEKGKKENLMMLDKKIMQNFNKELKTESSDLVKMIRERERTIMIMAIVELFDELELKSVGFPDSSDWSRYKFVRNSIRDWAKSKGINLLK